MKSTTTNQKCETNSFACFPLALLKMGLSDKAVILYGVLRGMGPRVQIPIDSLSEICGYSRRTTERALEQLQAAGLLFAQLHRQDCKPSVYFVKEPHVTADVRVGPVNVDVREPHVMGDVRVTSNVTGGARLPVTPHVTGDVADKVSLTDAVILNGSDPFNRDPMIINKIQPCLPTGHVTDQLEVPSEHEIQEAIRNLDLSLEEDHLVDEVHGNQPRSTPVNQPKVGAPQQPAHSVSVVGTPETSSASIQAFSGTVGAAQNASPPVTTTTTPGDLASSFSRQHPTASHVLVRTRKRNGMSVDQCVESIAGVLRTTRTPALEAWVRHHYA